MRFVIQIPADKYKPGIEDKIKSTLEAMAQEEVSVRTIKR